MSIFDGIDRATVDAFRTYHQLHPEIFQLFAKYAYEMRKTGRKRYSAKTIMERIRWHCDVSNPGEDWSINNDWTAMYARLLVHKIPEFEGFFEFRTCKGLKRASEGMRYLIASERAA